MKNKFDKGFVLFSKLCPYLKKYLYTNLDGLCSTEIWVLNSKDSRLINGFIYFFVQGTEFLEAANKSIGTKMPRTDWNSVSEIPFKIPAIKEQGKIVVYLKGIENKIVKEKEKLTVLEEQKRGFMWGMFV